MRGDRPLLEGWDTHMLLFTPHARGSTRTQSRELRRELVYPACAGIDRRDSRGLHRGNRLPRMRGDRPGETRARRCQISFTPHARGSTRPEGRFIQAALVYPACAGIDPRSLFDI